MIEWSAMDSEHGVDNLTKFKMNNLDDGERQTKDSSENQQNFRASLESPANSADCGHGMEHSSTPTIAEADKLSDSEPIYIVEVLAPKDAMEDIETT